MTEFLRSWAGLGVLMLRIVIGAAVVVQGSVYLVHHQLKIWIIAAVLITSGLLLFIGFITRAAALVAGLSGAAVIFSFLPKPDFIMFDSIASFYYICTISLVIILIGPGAFSIDARLFGRREIIIPKHPDNSSSRKGGLK